jgi:hypothetical protein
MTIIVTEAGSTPVSGPLTGQLIIDAAAFTLQDQENTTWTRLELLGYLNDGQRDACIVKPDAYVRVGTVPLVAGTRQLLPEDGAAFIRLVRNMGVDGLTPGRAPRKLDIATMDMQNPNWHSDVSNSLVMEYGHDEREPKAYYVSPPQPLADQGRVDLVYAAVPSDLPNEDSAVVLALIYKTALIHYICYRAYLKEGELQSNANAMAHRTEFLSLLGAKEAGEQKAAA